MPIFLVDSEFHLRIQLTKEYIKNQNLNQAIIILWLLVDLRNNSAQPNLEEINPLLLAVKKLIFQQMGVRDISRSVKTRDGVEIITQTEHLDH